MAVGTASSIDDPLAGGVEPPGDRGPPGPDGIETQPSSRSGLRPAGQALPPQATARSQSPGSGAIGLPVQVGEVWASGLTI